MEEEAAVLPVMEVPQVSAVQAEVEAVAHEEMAVTPRPWELSPQQVVVAEAPLKTASQSYHA